MVQVKKASVHKAIVAAADALFRERGFAATPMAAIARRADVAVSTIYVYYRSKLDLFFAIYEPWLMGCLGEMATAARAEPEAARRVRAIIDWIWIKIPERDNYFSNNLMEAVSTAGPSDAYSDGFLRRVQLEIAAMLVTIDPERVEKPVALDLAFLLLMAFDGFAMKIRISGAPPSEAFLETTAGMIRARLGLEGV
jgi:AcrR family transcriptional regulator